MTTTALDVELDRAAAVLSAASEVALACHVNPDPDALGSSLGLAGFLAAQGKGVVVSWGNEPFEPPTWMAALDGGVPVVPPADFPSAPPVMVALDTASADRLGSLGFAAEAATEVIVLDHHRTNPGFGTIAVIDPEASSTAELVYRLIERMGGDLPDRAAAALYAGIVTDTGRFQYEATTPETLRVAAELRRYSFDHTKLARTLFEDAPLAYLRVAALALERIELVPEASLVWTYVTQSDLARVGATLADTDDLIDLVRVVREADVACVIKQQADGQFKVSLRSKEATDVAAVAQRFGGGGHRLAAGYTATGGLEESVRELIAALPSKADG
ncbi:MAG TPA: bifunctional oligoribonuclease/PAP phosphatase NrnA [Actinomycetota bacterium]|nr:bifunctional oligoribonuclease/PAP phosphatase NrnA [Actinomycetota bacterium]